jgi:hypothetical protein
MSLTPEQIKALLTKPEKKPRGKRVIDHSVRDLQTWFKLGPKALTDDAAEDLPLCENPNCLDTRLPTISATGKEIKKQYTIEINGRRICRRCFLGGWLLENPAQLQL